MVLLLLGLVGVLGVGVSDGLVIGDGISEREGLRLFCEETGSV